MSPTPLKIDFVSDVSCPWCAIGLNSLRLALAQSQLSAVLVLQPFELNPGMPPQGENIIEHVGRKYGTAAGQIRDAQEMIRVRGEQVGFVFDMTQRTRVYNTFDAHRLLHWAHLQDQADMQCCVSDTATAGRQLALQDALFSAYFTHGRNPGDHAVLMELAVAAGLDGARAREILAGDEYADAVREREVFYQRHGIHAVPAVIVNDRHLIQGGQPPQAYEQALRHISAGVG